STTKIVVDENGDPIHLGAGYQVIRRSGADGSQTWSYAPPDVPGDAATMLAMGPNGDLAIAGPVHSDTSAPFDVLVVKLGISDGAYQAGTFVDGSFSGDDVPTGLAVDSSGNAFLAATVQSGTQAFDFLAAKLGAADGAEAWRLELDGSADDPPADESPYMND